MKKEFTTKLEFENMNELEEMFKEARYHLKEFNKTVKKINKFKLEMNVGLDVKKK